MSFSRPAMVIETGGIRLAVTRSAGTLRWATARLNPNCCSMSSFSESVMANQITKASASEAPKMLR